jgi:2-polyprenyl-3-methyl-5-hydroxy-6-metoxy-1,4-benzoquinol methylase
MQTTMTILNHKDAKVHVEGLPTGKNRICVELTNDDLFSPTQRCETSYPIDLIDTILHLKGPAYLCDELLRDESPDYVQKSLKYDLLSYLDIEELENKRLLDFGCGSGASTIVLARMFPHTEIVGIELEEQLLSIAKLRATYYGYKNIELMISPNPCSLPSSIGCFDFVVLSAVYEHLLPNEREVVLLQIWSILKPNGILFLNQTPYRSFPVESHTTSGLPFINYLPDKLALLYAQHFSNRKLKDKSWKELLRAGIRGGSVKEILSILSNCPQGPVLLNPRKWEIKDRIDLWYVHAQSGVVRLGLAKRVFRVLAKLLQWLTGVTIVPGLSLAIRKG